MVERNLKNALACVLASSLLHSEVPLAKNLGSFHV
jgi:hypothetical protein